MEVQPLIGEGKKICVYEIQGIRGKKIWPIPAQENKLTSGESPHARTRNFVQGK